MKLKDDGVVGSVVGAEELEPAGALRLVKEN